MMSSERNKRSAYKYVLIGAAIPAIIALVLWYFVEYRPYHTLIRLEEFHFGDHCRLGLYYRKASHDRASVFFRIDCGDEERVPTTRLDSWGWNVLPEIRFKLQVAHNKKMVGLIDAEYPEFLYVIYDIENDAVWYCTANGEHDPLYQRFRKEFPVQSSCPGIY